MRSPDWSEFIMLWMMQVNALYSELKHDLLVLNP